jgi:sugar lactone lactonase YvrE
MKLKHLIPGAFVLLLTSCLKDNPFDPKDPQTPSQVQFTAPNLFPEGVVYDPYNKRFYVSSTARGDIGIVTWQGIYTPLLPNASVFANDVALDMDGNAYVTNSHSPPAQSGSGYLHHTKSAAES